VKYIQQNTFQFLGSGYSFPFVHFSSCWTKSFNSFLSIIWRRQSTYILYSESIFTFFCPGTFPWSRFHPWAWMGLPGYISTSGRLLSHSPCPLPTSGFCFRTVETWRAFFAFWTLIPIYLSIYLCSVGEGGVVKVWTQMQSCLKVQPHIPPEPGSLEVSMNGYTK
jgi:hypothetical protein